LKKTADQPETAADALAKPIFLFEISFLSSIFFVVFHRPPHLIRFLKIRTEANLLPQMKQHKN